MRKIFVFVILLIGISNISFCQTNIFSTRITYTAIQKPLPDILQEIEKIANVRFTYNSSILSKTDLITISVQQKTLQEVLTALLKDKYEFKLIGDQILIYEKPQRSNLKVVPKQSTNNPQPKQSNPIPQPKKNITDTVKIYDTIRTRIIDTVRIKIYDTIYKNDRKNSKTYIKPNTSLTFTFVTGQLFSMPLTSVAINNTYKKKLKSSEQLGWGNIESIWATYNKQNVLFGLGISHSNIRYKSIFTAKKYINDGTNTYTDTLWYWKYNKLFTYYKFNSTGDSVAITVYDSVYAYTLKENPKKIEKLYDVNSIVSLHYISIPVSIGYSFPHNNFIFEPSFTLFTQFLTNRKGIIPSISGDFLNINDLPIKKFTYSLGVSCNTRYIIHSNYSVSIRPFFIIQPKVYKSSNLFQKTIPTFGLEWGISYTIPYELF